MHRHNANTASPLPAWLDVVQGASGLALVLFMWAHMFFVSSVLLGKDAMYWVSRMFEGEPLFGRPYPLLVSAAGVVIFLLIAGHAVLALRTWVLGGLGGYELAPEELLGAREVLMAVARGLTGTGNTAAAALMVRPAPPYSSGINAARNPLSVSACTKSFG